MFKTLLRVIGGFLLACLAAGLAKVLFVYPPAGFATAPASEFSTQTADALMLALLAATHSAIFGAVFALIAVFIGEWLAIRGVLFYVLAGVTVALLGFFAQYSSEVAGQPTIFNSYAMAAFLTAGLSAGLVYWYAAGRLAGGKRGLGFDFNDSPRETAKPFRLPRIFAASPTDDGKKSGSLTDRLDQADVKIETKAAAAKPEATTSVPATKPPAKDAAKPAEQEKT